MNNRLRMLKLPEKVITSRTKEFNNLFRRKFPLNKQRVIYKPRKQFPKPLFHIYIADENGEYEQLY